MSDELTRLLTETLRSRANDAEPSPGLSARVLQKGRSARNRRLALGWGATGLFAVFASTAVVLGPVGRLLPNPGPANRPTQSPTATSTPTSTSTSTESVSVDPLLAFAQKLPLGPPVGWLPRAETRGTGPTSRAVVVTAHREVTLPADAGTAFDLTASAEGLLVTTTSKWFTGGDRDPDQALYLIRPDGSLKKLHKGPFHGVAVDPTGRKFAIAEVGLRLGAPVHIVVASLSQPGMTTSHTEPESTTLLGWTTQGLLMSDTSRSWLWKPGASSEPEIPHVVGASVIPTDPDRLLVETRQGPQTCLHLYTLTSKQMGPVLTCGDGNGSIVSPDGRRTAFGSSVVDLVTGRVGPELMNNLAISFAHWEDSTHVLTHVSGQDKRGGDIAIWVRCDVTTGVCEQAPTSAHIDGY